MNKPQKENHQLGRFTWLRAAVLGANDGIISTSSLIIGVAAAHTSHGGILIAGSAGLIAGAMSMAAGEYISVSSQADSEGAELEKERRELREFYPAEIKELAGIYVKRGLNAELAEKVATELMEHDALGAHARDELGITDTLSAQPLLAAFSSGCSFTVGAVFPLLVAIFSPVHYLIPFLSVMTVVFLAILGGLAAYAGGSRIVAGAIRVMVWGTLAMVASAGIGAVLGVAV